MKKIIPTIIGMLLPVAAFAQCQGVTEAQGQDATGVLNIIDGILGIAIPIIVTLGVAYFFFGVVKYITAKDDEGKKEARSTMISGITGLFVIVALWGIIALLSNTLGIGIGGSGAGVVPTI